MKNVRIVDITDGELKRLVGFIERVVKTDHSDKWTDLILNADRAFTLVDELREGVEDPVEISDDMRAAMEKVYIG